MPPTTTEEEDFFEPAGLTATATPLRDARLYVVNFFGSNYLEAIIRKQSFGSNRHDAIYIYQTCKYILIFFYSLLKNNKTLSHPPSSSF